MKLKEGIIVRPFGASSKLEGYVGEPVGKWLINKGLVTEEDFEPAEGLQIDIDQAIKEAEAAAKIAEAEETAAKPKRRATRRKK